MAPMSVPVSAGQDSGQSMRAMEAMAMPLAVRILPSGSARPRGSSSLMAAFSTSLHVGGV
jgi:hypothetical protein